ncbi:MAG: hypothetical protein L7V30_00755 [Gammaproteobacteria bacterium]|nr:hypothetical protein [Gammaproteobacteria bacterium]
MAEDNRLYKGADKFAKSMQTNRTIVQDMSAGLDDIISKHGTIAGLTEDETLALGMSVEKMKMANNLSDAAVILEQEKKDYIEESFRLNRDISDEMLKQFDVRIKMAKKTADLEKQTENLKDFGKNIADDLASSLGFSSGFASNLMNAGKAAIGLLFLKEVYDLFKSMATDAKNLSYELGISGNEAAKLGLEIKAATYSGMDGFLLGSEKVGAAMKSIVKESGNIALATGEMAVNVARLSELGVAANDAVSLARSLDNAGQNTEKLLDFADKTATKLGGIGSEGMKYLAANQFELNTLTEAQIEERIKEGILLKKMGADMDHLNKKASEALDIESSIKNEMKLRMMTGKEINMNALRAAQVSGDRAAIAREEAKLVKSLGPALSSNLQLQRLIGDATGLSKEQMLNYSNATGEAGDALAENTKEAGMLNGMFDGMGSIVTTVLMAIAGLAVAMLALWGLSKLFAFFKLGNPVTDFIGDFGSKDVLMGAAAMVLVAGSMYIFAMAMGKFSEVMSVDSVMATVVGMALLGGAMLVLALAVGNPATASMLLMASGAMLVLAAAFLVFGFAIQAIAKGFGMLADLGVQILELALMAPLFPIIGAGLMLMSTFLALAGIGLLFAAPGFLAFGIAMIPFAAGMAILGVALPLVADGIKSFSDIVGDLPNIASGLLALGISLIPLAGTMLILSASVPGLIAFSGGMLLLSYALGGIGSGIDNLANLTSIAPSLITLVSLVPGLFALSAALGALSLSLMGMSVSLAMIGLTLPVLMALGTLLPTVAGAFGMGDDSESSSSETDGGGMKAVVEAIDNLSTAVQSQDIVLQINGTTIQKLNRVMKQSDSLSNTQKSGNNGGMA